MSILSAATGVSTQKSAAEIQYTLASKGANSVSVQYENGEAAAIFFSMLVNDVSINFRLPSNWQGILKALNKDPKIPARLRTNDQAKKVAWRIILTWVKAQLALIEAGQADMAEVFMPYMINASGQTIYKMLEENPRLLIGN